MSAVKRGDLVRIIGSPAMHAEVTATSTEAPETVMRGRVRVRPLCGSPGVTRTVKTREIDAVWRRLKR